jgi:hypothetical protein
MKKILSIALITVLSFNACTQNTSNTDDLQKKVDSLEQKLADTYKPGFGEFMSSIQMHHNKLWFAGENENWKLADFEIHEIIEAVESIKKYQNERVESQKMEMLLPALDSVNLAIEQKNSTLFKSSYVSLTNTCNNCHRATNFEFNVVKIPDVQPFSNQDFKSN